MEEHMNEAGGRRGGKKVWMILCAVLAAALAAYLGLCAFAVSRDTIWQGVTVLGQDVGGLTVAQAAEKLNRIGEEQSLSLYLYPLERDTPPARGDAPDARITLSELGAQIDGEQLARDVYEIDRAGFLAAGWRYLTNPERLHYSDGAVTLDAGKTAAAIATADQKLSFAPQDTAYELGDGCVEITAAKDGRALDTKRLNAQLVGVDWCFDLALDVAYTTETAKVLTAQEIYDAVAGEMKNAGYDAAADTITAERTGVEFDAAGAQRLMDGAQPGETVEVPAQIQQPRVTAEELRGVLFRDVLGTYTTHVGGTAERIGNVKLSSSAVNGSVLNCGDIFSYNETVGQRTEAKGYQPAPAYVKGETVDEIGGGVCQPSSTLYLACLLANLEITERAAHRYVPAYIPKGMDATVSWGGPDYKFRNDTDYPIRIEASMSKGNYLTMTLRGTKTDAIKVKMTNKVLTTTEWKTVYKDDATLAADSQQVKVTPYTGYRVETYRSLYNGDGTLLSSRREAVSDYKVRDRLILVGPKTTSGAGSGASSEPGTETGTPANGTETGTPANGTETGTPANGTETGTPTNGTETGTPAGTGTGDAGQTGTEELPAGELPAL